MTASSDGPAPAELRQSGRKAELSPVETPDFILFAQRIIGAAGRRVAAGELDALGALESLKVDVDAALDAAVAGLRSEDGGSHAWSAIGVELGVTRQAAMQRFPTAGGARRAGGQPTNLR